MSIEQIFVFGDSLSDTGNINNLTGGTLELFYPKQETQNSNGLSNGLLWIDHLSESLDLEPKLLTELRFDTPDNLMIGDGINFAIAGANSNDSNYNPDLRLNPSDNNGAGLTEQIQAFDILTGLTHGQVANPNDSLYTLWIGSNDYLSYVLTPNQKINAIQQVKQTINNISNGLKDIIDIATNQLGDENPDIVVFNLPNLAMTPLVQNLSRKEQKTMDKMIDKHNKWLEKELKKLDKLYSNVNFISLDIATQFELILEDESITNSTDAATQTNIYSGTFDFSLIPGPPFNPLADPFQGLNDALAKAESYVFWDSVHPTAVVHELIGDYVIERLSQENLFSSEIITFNLDQYAEYLAS